MERDEIRGPSPTELALLVERIIQDPSPRLRYTAGATAQRVAAVLKRLLPASIFERGLMMTYGLR